MAKLPRDSVEREIVIKGPVERVWAALTDPAQFPTWGPERIEGRLEPGQRPVLDFGPTGGGRVRVYVVAVQAPTYFAYRWMQGETKPEVLLRDPLEGHNTLVEFRLESAEGGTRVRVVESGLSALPGVPGLDPDVAAEQMGQGWSLMLGALDQAILHAGEEMGDTVGTVVSLAAPPDRVWDALIHPERWWARKVEGEIRPGELVVLDHGEFGRFRILVVQVRAREILSYRRVQGVDDPRRWMDDLREAPSTLVELRLDPGEGGTRIALKESGFGALRGEGVRAHQRKAAQGWGIVLGLLKMHLEKP